MDIIGQRLAGKYEVKSEIGQGGMGVVYEGYDGMLRRRVAVKVLAPHLAGDPAFVKRFQHEAAAAAGLHHPNIVTIFDVGSERGVNDAKQPIYYIVMQYVDGQGLDRWLQQQKRLLTMSDTDRIVRQVADALQYAHDQGMIHRDVKPSNVMLDTAGHVTLMDFGLVRASEMSHLTQSGMAIGTPSYMAPEQITGGPIDRRTDVYALGVVIYELLVGEAPFVRTTPVATAHAHVYDPPPPLREKRPDLPPSVEAVVLKALAKSPDNRYAQARVLAADLALASTGQMPVGLQDAARAGAKDPTVPMDRPPARPPAFSDATVPADQPAVRPQTFSDESMAPAHSVSEPRVAAQDPDFTVVSSREAPISAWSTAPIVPQSTPQATASRRSSPTPEKTSASGERWMWVGVGLGLIVALALLVIGLTDQSIGLVVAGVLIGVAGVAAAAVTGRASRMRSRTRQPSASGQYCLRCGHELPYANAICPSCGYKGGFEEIP